MLECFPTPFFSSIPTTRCKAFGTSSRWRTRWRRRFMFAAFDLTLGDLLRLSVEARRVLDEANLSHLKIFASGGLDEREIGRLLRAGAPIDAFGVGTDMSVSGDAPSLDIAYKLTEYAGTGRMKLSTGKRADTVRKELVKLGFSRESNRKADEGSNHPDRNAQFKHINAKVIAAQVQQQPVMLRIVIADHARDVATIIPWESRLLVALFPSGDLFVCAKHLFVEAINGAGCSNHAASATDDQLR